MGHGAWSTLLASRGSLTNIRGFTMSFADAVRTCLTGYATFSGRARRSEYWWFSLFFAVVYLLAVVVGSAAHVSILGPLAMLALVIPMIAVAVRRLHDTNR